MIRWGNNASSNPTLLRIEPAASVNPRTRPARALTCRGDRAAAARLHHEGHEVLEVLLRKDMVACFTKVHEKRSHLFEDIVSFVRFVIVGLIVTLRFDGHNRRQPGR